MVFLGSPGAERCFFKRIGENAKYGGPWDGGLGRISGRVLLLLPRDGSSPRILTNAADVDWLLISVWL